MAMPEDASFASLIGRVRAGDAAAAAELVRLYEPTIRVIVRRRLTDTAARRLLDSTDICQSVLANFFVRAAAGQFELDTPDQLLRLAQISREVALGPGSMLFDEADPGALYVLASGEATLDSDGGTALRAGPGATLGVFEALAGVSRGHARAEAAGVALRLEREALLELLASDTALLQGILGALLERNR